ncbi:MAG: Ribosomal protein S12 methylthiotransferase RimO [candidate division BRC1 bacterium ADurb.BinA364]|nr:MAG: Ribosomal protein S12 methylthiotransferase RimO [candidate division BRC1 bacterium ADurb.BinA364]
MSSRGCPYRCSFCASAKHWGRFRAFSANYVAREIEWLRERYDPEIILFFDDLFIADDERFRRTGALLKERGLLEGIRFRCFARANLIGEAMADFLMEHHFSMLDFGFESNDEEVLRFLGKARVTPETNQQAVDVLRARGASIGGSFIIGCPGEDEQAIGRTWDFMISNAPYFDRMSFGPLQALPGTAIWDWALERGLVSEEMDWSRLAYYEDTFDPERFPLLCDSMEKADFMRWHERIAALCHRINQSGHIRALDEKLARAGGEIARLRGELDSLRGSRLVRGALGLRRALGRVRGARR